MTSDTGAARRPLGEGTLRTVIPEFSWPAFPDDATAQVLALLYQLEESQWWAPRLILKRQLEQAGVLIEHARRNVPFYGQRLPAVDGRLTLNEWQRLPIASRAELQGAGERFFARTVPPGHGPVQSIETSGSTGRPLRALATAPVGALNLALNLRGILWHELDLSATAASIRKLHEGEPRQAASGWGACFESGTHLAFDVMRPVDEQIDWLLAQRPRYLLTYATALDAIARRCEARALALDFLAGLSTFGEVLDPGTRERCRRALNLEIIDSYSAQETGVLTTQCPEAGAHHVAAEGVLLEVLDERGRPCRPGSIGRVVVTCLHNFASPLIRYEIGDYAEVGPACRCGRGLPVLTRILGRSRNMLALPDGTRRWPFASSMEFARHEPIRQFQIVQKSLESIEVRLAVARPLTDRERAEFAAVLIEGMGHPFRVEFRFLDEVPRGSGGKFEDFLCEVPAPR